MQTEQDIYPINQPGVKSVAPNHPIEIVEKVKSLKPIFKKTMQERSEYVKKLLEDSKVRCSLKDLSEF